MNPNFDVRIRQRRERSLIDVEGYHHCMHKHSGTVVFGFDIEEQFATFKSINVAIIRLVTRLVRNLIARLIR